MVHIAKWKVIVVVVVCAFGVLFSIPNFLSRETADALPGWLPHQQISLGLDLQGGSHLLLEVDVASVIRERQDTLVETLRTELRNARIRYTGLGVRGQSVAVTIPDTDRVQAAYDLVRNLESGIKATIEEGGRITLTVTEQAIAERTRSAVEQSIEIVRRRIDETGVREPIIIRQGEDRILVQLPGLDDPERIKQLLGKTAKMTFHLVDDQVPIAEAMAGRLPPGSMLMPSSHETVANGQPRMYVVSKRVMLSGDALASAQVGTDPRTSEPVVNFRFDAAGGKRFGKITTENVNRLLAIVLDGKVISAPNIREPILGGSGQISGSFSFQSAQDLALLLRAGALPAPLTILEERTVGPGLGADSIAAGKVASVIGLILVVVIMVLVYGRFGAVADIAVVFNMFLIMASLSVLQATLTLPGIAGIVLTVGMAVDANVLIFERIREELRNGRSPISAIETGYSQATRTIIDANLTTLIAAILLYQFGSGPVRGFAVTLAIGIAASMFTGVMMTHVIVLAWLRRARPQTLKI
jgi:preprotein translocase subunit SecD